MVQRIHNKMGTAGLIVACIALVFAMLGGAYAATSSSKRQHKRGGLTGAQKKLIQKEAKKWGKKFAKAGPAGPAGSAGAKGDAGANGTDGANGSNGTNGADGNTVLSGSGAPLGVLGNDGDFYIDTDTSEIYGPKTGGSWGSATSLQGSPWSAGGTLPSTGTLTGTYSALEESGPEFPVVTPSMGDGTSQVLAGPSFALPVDPAPTFVFVPTVTGPEETIYFGTDAANGCDGVVDGVPQADPGKFCVYGAGFSTFGVAIPTATVTLLSATQPYGSSPSPTGAAQFKLDCSSPTFGVCVAKGVWAVTGS